SGVSTLRWRRGAGLGVREQEAAAASTSPASLRRAALPPPPIYRKVSPAAAPILTLAITSETLPLPVVHDLVDTRMAQKLAQLSGVGMVSLAGGQRPALRVQVNPGAQIGRAHV